MSSQKKCLDLLIVEDDITVQDVYKQRIEYFNQYGESNIEINLTIESDKDNALNLLSNTNRIFDGAIVDLDLKNSGGNDSSGNEVIREIKQNLRFPIFVISGTTHNLDSDLHGDTAFFKVRKRDDDEFDFCEEFVNIYNTGITNILNRKGMIEQHINKIFWNHLSNSMDLWIGDTKRTPEQKQNTLLRFFLLHVQEYLELTTESDFEKYHAAEFYITPPIKGKVYTGDVIIEKGTEKRYIVLTPSCDLAQSKAKEVLLAEIESKDKDGILKNFINIIHKDDKIDSLYLNAEADLKKIISNSYSNKYHYLPKYQDICDGLINFQKLKTVKNKDFCEGTLLFERIASVNSSFTKDIVARFSYYYSRQGSPDFDVDEIYESLIDK
ncbi:MULTISPECIES: response regulator [Myroides]|uniref:response regulator n=1 Tax=Myroides TaxID=76831 RepID=UPI000280A724|nr:MULTISPECIES: response regulator [Myroides]APA91042.1 hypothetical protein BK054_02075 [Myroides sp. ZB35]EKB02199.1 hypothetical protein HMPREF9711_03405 [Myroides odoratimimus CCUG 3837]